MAFDVVLTPDFKRELKHIAKKHKQILTDLNTLIDELIVNPTLGTNLGQNVYKIRLAISGTNKGKSGGARVITYVYIEGETVYLSEIYLKSEHDTVDVKAVIERLHDEGFV
ncbi:mRNA-degrading endonuclease RelE of RelBE toxin-antitoxin system [Pedobacter sp. AK017]|uniref:type II toxin-antitoxin system RelE/ParE family toxin n=1 Tax=Pedobacter sp. AK017 TaxID=2723073 RepID=UPI001621BE8B|nr:type II toxin-antitoxin system RelE/ParE family toxin [Pedobacter sp. AK017]MBB5436919.1 mRNA-degrading endonuclease RelE of RelBE toxin-antitoxin system [Pedobacter sp. AK017]